MTDQQQTEQTDELAEPNCIVVILTDGTVAKWPAKTTSFNAHDDGDLTLVSLNGDGCVAVFARGQWSAVYDDTHLAS